MTLRPIVRALVVPVLGLTQSGARRDTPTVRAESGIESLLYHHGTYHTAAGWALRALDAWTVDDALALGGLACQLRLIADTPAREEEVLALFRLAARAALRNPNEAAVMAAHIRA